MFRNTGDRGAPKVISHYQVDRLLGSGGMGSVYLATDRRDGTPVAVKLLHRHLSDDPSFRDRFEQEAHVAALLRSPYTVHVLEHGIVRGQCYIAMEYVQGETLKGALAGGPLPPARAMRIAVQVARALEEAEARGVVHRDIKPENILLRGDDSVKVADFGIARHLGTAALSAPGSLIGTLSYAAPEQLLGNADHRSDIYSLGATLYCTLAGRPPFTGDVSAMLASIREAPVATEPLAGLPEELVAVVQRCLEKDPDDRYQSASELAGALTLAAQSSPDTALAATLPLTVSPGWSAVSLRLTPRRSRLPFAHRLASTTYNLTARNEGDEVVELRLRAEDDGAACRFSMPETIAVLPGSTAKAAIAVRPLRRRWRGPRERRIFTAYGSLGGGQPPVAVAGQFDDQPYGWLPALAGGSLLGIGATVLAGLSLLGVFAGAPQPTPLRIGVIMPITNVGSEFGTAYLNSARVAAAGINDDGGILGRPVQVVPADSAGDPDTAVLEAQRLIQEEQVQAIISEDWDHLSLDVAEQSTEPNEVLHVSIGAPFKLASEKRDFWFRPVAASAAARGLAIARLVKDQGYRRLCSVYMSDDIDLHFQRMHEAFVVASPELEVVAVPYDFGQDQPAKVRERCSGMDAIVLLVWDASEFYGPVADPIPLLREAAATGADLVMLEELKSEEVVGETGWDLLDGARGSDVYLADENIHDDFAAAYQRLFGPLPEGLGDVRTPYQAAYDAVYLIALAAESAGSTDPAAIRDAMDDVANEPGTVIKPGEPGFRTQAKQLLADGRDIDYDGASGPIQFDENGDNTRSLVGFWRVDAATRGFVMERRFLLDIEKGTLEELPP